MFPDSVLDHLLAQRMAPGTYVSTPLPNPGHPGDTLYVLIQRVSEFVFTYHFYKTAEECNSSLARLDGRLRIDVTRVFGTTLQEARAQLGAS